LRQCQAVVPDGLVNPAVLKLARRARVFQAGKRGPGAPSGAHRRLSQARINSLLIRLARRGWSVVRLKGGDPFVFGRGREELEALKKAGIPYEVVPGVSSAIAAPAYAGIPITDRRLASQVTWITGHQRSDGASRVDWDISSRGTLVVLMGVSQWPGICRRLLKKGWARKKPVAAIESATTPAQRVVLSTLADSVEVFRSRRVVAPAVIVVGEVVRFAAQLGWRGNTTPLDGIKIVVTRPVSQAKHFVRMLREAGAHVLLCPLIRIEPLSHLRQQVKELRPGDWDQILLFSANAARLMDQACRGVNEGLRTVSVCAIGPRTAREARSRGWKVAKVAATHDSQGVLAALGRVQNKKFLIPRVQDGPQEFVRELVRRGAHVREFALYRTVAVSPSRHVRREILGGADAVTFASASAARSFFEAFRPSEIKRIFERGVVVSIGSQTTRALRRGGLREIVESPVSTGEGMLEAIKERFSRPGWPGWNEE